MNLPAKRPLKPFTESDVEHLREIQLPAGVRLVEYHNGGEQVFYENEAQHTFSLYLDGGFETFRTDAQGPKGAPSHFCLMPQDSYSAWDVGTRQRFAHLYFSDDYLKRIALTTFDMDPRRVSLPQLTFAHDPALDAIFRHSLMSWDWTTRNSALAVEQGVQTLLVNLIRGLGVGKSLPESLSGGLSPRVMARVLEFIEANLDRPILLGELAQQAGLSEYHFARMFKISQAQTPQQCITRLRLERAKRLLCLQPAQSLADISLACGFSSQSHLGRVFKQYLGVTPGSYRQQVSG